ncbi:bacterioferritin [Gluconacetobacter sp. 1b LMG 1731]|uniref:Bacterioferritin-associated ferredoxin n=2 Tax=Gluconacetobacter TaxID=89583 RepID=A0A7W4JXD0_9PROT|nr:MULTISPECIES: (2Fe-2S)-binding protein [Gluconacetobacter]MBB2164756.1 bacterioferritin [Gluconacetobacter dulcium]MBB2187075.1 bacterioferritin [Gluconacetobacter liquefaciens]MBB2193892.1 bacterioferritin [Gluconacetobacter dulcium]MBB2196365.1 bacterioferritin [Gluconacetobacter dulcium]RDI37051.1 BFD-like [2Fe-2S] binding protein [Gluconacetobacter liquefaciens]
MIVCSCNALSHTDIESAIRAGASRPAEIHAARQCRAQCGNCVPGMLCLLRNALKAATLEGLPNADAQRQHAGHA